MQRGSVVVRRSPSGGAFGVVHAIQAAGVLIFPVTRPGRRRRVHDVELAFGEIVASGIVMDAALIRVGQPMLLVHPVEADDPAGGLEHVGQLAGTAVCRVTLALIRAVGDARMVELCLLDRRHRAQARDNRPVKMVG